MRSGGCAVQQALAAEAAAVVRQAVALARRRGHAQVTPLHVASAMLSAAGGLLRAACLRAHSHPLQCKALDLCFNVALNRLPASAAGGPAAAAAMFHGHLGAAGYGGGGGHLHHAPQPVLSNALVAAFKRAQAHQRRGAVEGQPPPPSQQQQVLASSSKVELEQLVVSILDDPSVSRVMREAGFSSSQIKANVEKAAASSPEHRHSTPNTTTSPSSGHATRRRLDAKVDDDAMRVLDCMVGGSKRCAVVVGESVPAAEGVVKAVMDRVSKGELHPRHERLLKNLQFVPLSAVSFQRMSREEVEAKAGDLRALVRQGCAAGKGVVLVLEDLAYAAEAWAAASESRKRGELGSGFGRHRYCPVEHGVMEVSSLVSAARGGSGLDRFWLLGFGNNQAYMKCRAGQPSLEAVWELHPVVVADGGVSLSLGCIRSEAQLQARHERSRTGWPFINSAVADGSDLIAGADVVTVRPNNLPQWLRGHQDSEHNGPESCSSTSLQLKEWNRDCNGSAAHPASELTLSFSSLATVTTSPAPPSISGFANNYNTNMRMSCKPCQFVPMQPWLNHRYDDPMANSYDHHQTLHGNPSPESYSVSNSSESGAAVVQPKFTELTAENLRILCSTLENRVPHRKDMVAGIASTVLQCRSGITRRMKWHREKPNVATWLLFHGRDSDGKKAVAQELARLVFGSYTNFTSISLSNYTQLHTKSSSGDIVRKRQRSPDNVQDYLQKLYDTILESPHRVIMIDGVDQLECDQSEISIKSAITNGRITSCNGDETNLEDVIVILSCEALDSRTTASSPRLKQRVIDNEDDEGNGKNTEKRIEPSCFMLDLNACVEDGDGDIYEGGSSDILNIVDGVFLFQLTEDL